MLPTPAGIDGGAADGRDSGSDQDTGVRELELQIDALYGMPSNSAGTTGQSPIHGVQAPVVSFMLHFPWFIRIPLSGMEFGKMWISSFTLTWL